MHRRLLVAATFLVALLAAAYVIKHRRATNAGTPRIKSLAVLPLKNLSGDFAPAHQTLGWAYLNQGKRNEALREFQLAVELSGTDDTDLLLDLGFAYATLGDREKALEIMSTLRRGQMRGVVPSGSIAILYGALGDLNAAFSWLERAYQERDPELTYLKVPGRRFEPLRHDSRFQNFVHRISFPE